MLLDGQVLELLHHEACYMRSDSCGMTWPPHAFAKALYLEIPRSAHI